MLLLSRNSSLWNPFVALLPLDYCFGLLYLCRDSSFFALEIICCIGAPHCMSLQAAVFLKTSLKLHLLLQCCDVLKGTRHVTIKGLLLSYAAFESYIPNAGKTHYKQYPVTLWKLLSIWNAFWLHNTSKGLLFGQQRSLRSLLPKAIWSRRNSALAVTSLIPAGG